MQRTVKATEITFAKVEMVNGELTTHTDTRTIAETDTTKAIKRLVKEVGNVAIVETKTVENLYVLDDEIFFKYAKKVEPKAE